MTNSKTNTLSKRNNGYIYIAFNESMPGWIKIGMTKKKPNNRMASLSQSTPLDFTVLHSEHIPMVTRVEADIKNLFNPKTINIKGKKYKVNYKHGREWIYYGNNHKLSPLSTVRTWNSRGDLIKRVKDAIKQSLVHNAMGCVIGGMLR
jgi:hypothetical protein